MYVFPGPYEIDTYLNGFWTDQQHPPRVIPTPAGYVPGAGSQSMNALLNFPAVYPFSGYRRFVTGPVDLTPLREICLHCTLSQNQTLHLNGACDCIARIPIDVDVALRHLGPSDAISCSDCHFRTIRFQLRDWTGGLVPVGSFVVVEICFLDSDPNAA